MRVRKKKLRFLTCRKSFGGSSRSVLPRANTFYRLRDSRSVERYRWIHTLTMRGSCRRVSPERCVWPLVFFAINVSTGFGGGRGVHGFAGRVVGSGWMRTREGGGAVSERVGYREFTADYCRFSWVHIDLQRSLASLSLSLAREKRPRTMRQRCSSASSAT